MSTWTKYQKMEENKITKITFLHKTGKTQLPKKKYKFMISFFNRKTNFENGTSYDKLKFQSHPIP